MGAAEDEAELRDSQVHALLTNARTLTMQMAEIVVAQEAAVRVGVDRDKRIERIEVALKANTEVTEEVRDLLSAFRGGFRVLGWLGTGAKWIGAIAAAGMAIYTAVYAATHGGSLPGGKP